MTKREICERLMNIHNSVMFASNGSGEIGGSPCYGVGKAIRDLILDIAVPETEKDVKKRQDDFMRRCNLLLAKEKKEATK